MAQDQGGDTPQDQGDTQGQGNTQPTGVVIHGSVFGGGNLADVGRYHMEVVDGKNTEVFNGSVTINNVTIPDQHSSTTVNICAKLNSQTNTYEAVSSDVTIYGNVYGGGKGEATTFR